MRKLYKYTGTVSSLSYHKNSRDALPFIDLVLSDLDDDNKAPDREEAHV